VYVFISVPTGVAGAMCGVGIAKKWMLHSSRLFCLFKAAAVSTTQENSQECIMLINLIKWLLLIMETT
jgi:hypothetical protein